MIDKIHITGNAGSGKSTLAKQLGTALGLPVFSLDTIVWQPGWTNTPRDVIDEKERELTSKPEWIIEGVSHHVRNAATLVIFLDVSRRTSIVRCAKRNWRFLFSGRPELPENCPEILIIPRLLKIIWTFKNKVRPNILKTSSARPLFLIVRHDKDLKHVYDQLGLSQPYPRSPG